MKHKIKELLTAYEQELAKTGETVSSFSREAKGAKLILDAGYTADDAIACYRHYKKERFWQDKTMSLTYVAGNIRAFMFRHGAKKKPTDTDLEKWYRENNT